MSFPPYALQNAATRAAVAAFKNKASADLLRGARADRAPPAGNIMEVQFACLIQCHALSITYIMAVPWRRAVSLHYMCRFHPNLRGSKGFHSFIRCRHGREPRVCSYSMGDTEIHPNLMFMLVRPISTTQWFLDRHLRSQVYCRDWERLIQS